MTHTPAPWILDASPRYDGVTSKYDDYHLIDAGNCIDVDGATGFTGFHISAFLPHADALLIAAAPDLLEAAKSALSIMSETATDQTDTQWMAATAGLIAAIAKAEGRT